jgi:DNA-binding MarR family transcriptional regulator
MDKPSVTEAALQELRDQHIGRLLLQAQRTFNNQAIEKLRQRGYQGLGVTHTALLPHLDLDGTRITVLAERAGMTKQGMGQLVADLERQGLVTRKPDPADGRAILVQFTDAGWTYLRDAHEVKKELEADYAQILGASGLAELRSLLTALIDHQAPDSR